MNNIQRNAYLIGSILNSDFTLSKEVSLYLNKDTSEHLLSDSLETLVELESERDMLKTEVEDLETVNDEIEEEIKDLREEIKEATLHD